MKFKGWLISAGWSERIAKSYSRTNEGKAGAETIVSAPAFPPV